MRESISARSITVIAAASFTAASLVAVFAFVVPEANAESNVKPALHQSLDKTDQLRAAVKGHACSSRSWPHYEQRCLFDRRMPTAQAPSIRVIALR